tara:strand:- start:27 stop:563 length:537 start_codon:yes stop_codon:yes gene_type:complete
MKKKKNRKEKLIENLREEVLCRIGPSEIHGVGVFAIKDIPKGAELFKTSNKLMSSDHDIIDLSEEELTDLDDEVVTIIKSNFVKSHLGSYSLPKGGPNELFWGYFINHSSVPNLSFKIDEEDKQGFVKFVANREIKRGEELTEDYSYLSKNKIFLMEQFKFLERRATLEHLMGDAGVV